MGHGKLRKFAENETFSCLLQPSPGELLKKEDEFRLCDHPIKGRWNSQMFSREQPIVLELGCGRGEYTISLAQRMPQFNYIGVDIKGARLWKGAKFAHEKGLSNVAFLRTRIEFIEAFFAPGEVTEIWLTFSDPQLKKENCRLTSPIFLERYRHFLAPGGKVHLKTDSFFLHKYTLELAKQNGLPVLACTDDLYGKGIEESFNGTVNLRPSEKAALFEVQTYYEKMFLMQGLPITYLCFNIDHDGTYVSPKWDEGHWKAAEVTRGMKNRQKYI